MAGIGYTCRFCGAGGGTNDTDTAPLFYRCHVCKKPEGMIPRRMFEQLQEVLKQGDEAKNQLANLKCALTPQVVDLIRCGIGGNYSGQNYEQAMAKYHQPVVQALASAPSFPPITGDEKAAKLNVVEACLGIIEQVKTYTVDNPGMGFSSRDEEREAKHYKAELREKLLELRDVIENEVVVKIPKVGLTDKQIGILKHELVPLITQDVTPLLGKVIEKRLTLFAEEIAKNWSTP